MNQNSFQSTCLREARHGRINVHRDLENFNPRAYARHDDIDTEQTILEIISIHVPTRGTTIPGQRPHQSVTNFNPRAYARHDLRPGRTLLLGLVFQSTCLREARPWPAGVSIPHGHFNPRAYARHDRRRCQRRASRRISIHVPTRGTTRTVAVRARSSHFNPRAYARHDVRILTLRPKQFGFQSTCLREARPSCSFNEAFIFYFNPRAYARHDSRGGEPQQQVPISIHVPTRGTTLAASILEYLQAFQSTCLREARLGGVILGGVILDFNPRAYARHDSPGEGGIRHV